MHSVPMFYCRAPLSPLFYAVNLSDGVTNKYKLELALVRNGGRLLSSTLVLFLRLQPYLSHIASYTVCVAVATSQMKCLAELQGQDNGPSLKQSHLGSLNSG